VRTGFSQRPRKKLVLFHGQEDVGVQYTSVPSSLLQGREKMALYCLGKLVTPYSKCSTYCRSYKLRTSEEERYIVLVLMVALLAWLEKRGGLVVVCTVTPVVAGSLVSVLETVEMINFHSLS
jgi:hypothetical protein